MSNPEYEVRYVDVDNRIHSTKLYTMLGVRAFMKLHTNSCYYKNGYEVPGERLMPNPPMMKG